jgi:hypothetical protein
MIRSGSSGASSYSINNESIDSDLRKVRTQIIGVEMMGMYFPWDGSSFYAAVVGRIKHLRNGYNEWRYDFNTTGLVTNVEWEDQSYDLGSIVGFNLRYEDMTAFTFGYGMTRRVLNHRRFVDTGNSDQVNRDVREKTLASYDEYRERLAPMYLAMFTYSFKP